MDPAREDVAPAAGARARLDAVAAGARRGREFLLVWATATADAALARTLRGLAVDAAAVADACAAHLQALGTPARPRTDDDFEARLAVAASGDDAACFDLVLGGADAPATDPASLLDADDDAATRALLERYVAAEHRAADRLRAHRDGAVVAMPSLLARLDAACAALRPSLDATGGP